MRTNQVPLGDLGNLGIFGLMAKALTFLPPESRTSERHAAAAPADVPVPRRGFLERLDGWFWAQQQRDVEAYLARSTDIYDLETRIRSLERDVTRSFP